MKSLYPLDKMLFQKQGSILYYIFIFVTTFLIAKEASALKANDVLSASIQDLATDCDPDICSLPTCRCSVVGTPGELDPMDVPQFVLLTFDDLIPTENYAMMERLTQYTNPNGCNMSMTFYINHFHEDYTWLNKLHRWGHEIGIHTISHAEPPYHNEELWTRELMDQKIVLDIYGHIKPDQTRGFRAPYLYIEGNDMYGVLSDNDFLYDCSWPSLEYTPWYSSNGEEPRGALWPYTLNYYSTQEHTVGIKPNESFPQLWLNPMTDLQDNKGNPCNMVDVCESATDELDVSAAAVFEFLKRNFEYHYNKSRTPYGLYNHHHWFTYDDAYGESIRRAGLEMFVEYLTTLPDVYLTTVETLIEWTRNPVPLDQLDTFEPLQCTQDLPLDTCPPEHQILCYYNQNMPIGAPSEALMHICSGPCPPNYPWVGNPYGD